jgi:hypothetical protein
MPPKISIAQWLQAVCAVLVVLTAWGAGYVSIISRISIIEVKTDTLLSQFTTMQTTIEKMSQQKIAHQ